MATYKVIQDIEAEDKLIGPLTLRQFIYACIGVVCAWLSVLSVTKHVPFMLLLFAPIVGVTGFFAFPWRQDQPTEIWALARVRFLFKSRRRIWDQSGAKELVTITVPKKIERILTNGLSQDQVRSRLAALASTVDSRGWAVKNVAVGLGARGIELPRPTSDRLMQASSLPQQVSDIDVRASDDILDPSANPVAQHLDSMISAATAAHRQQLMAQMQQPSVPAPAATSGTATGQPGAAGQPTDFWFMQPTAAVPGQATFTSTPVVVPGMQTAGTSPAQQADLTAEEQTLLAKLHAGDHNETVAYGHMKVIKTPEQLAAETTAAGTAPQPTANPGQLATTSAPQVTPAAQAVILDLSNNDDLDVATLARQAHKAQDDGEVVISLR